MTQAKHTPWDFLVNDGAWEVFDTRGHTVACNLTEANARLIAAAPDLLEALQMILQLNPQLPMGCIEYAEAAIAKATGA